MWSDYEDVGAYYECDVCSWETDSTSDLSGDKCPSKFCVLDGRRFGVGSTTGGFHHYFHSMCKHGEKCTDGSGYGCSWYAAELSCKHNCFGRHTATEYISCSSTYPCQNSHYSYSTTNHYYCTTHGYVGTSSTCPGLTISPSPSSMTLYVGQSGTITPNANPSSASVSYSPSNSNTISVSSSGKVTGKNKGSATITVTGVL